MLRWLLTTLVVMATMTPRRTGVWVAARSQFRPGMTLLHLAVDNSTGFIYVGGVNHVYHLTADRLQPISVAVTGNCFLFLADFELSDGLLLPHLFFFLASPKQNYFGQNGWVHAVDTMSQLTFERLRS